MRTLFCSRVTHSEHVVATVGMRLHVEVGDGDIDSLSWLDSDVPDTLA